MGCTYEWKRLAGTDCVGCTCDRKQFRRIIVFFSSIVRISLFECPPVTHDLILPNVCARRAYPRRFLGRVGRTTLSATLTWRRSQMSFAWQRCIMFLYWFRDKQDQMKSFTMMSSQVYLRISSASAILQRLVTTSTTIS